MYNVKNFYLKSVVDINSKFIGNIKDIYLNIGSTSVNGFSILKSSILNREVRVDVKDIIYYNHKIVISKVTEQGGLKFQDIKGMNVIDTCGRSIGILENMIFDLNFDIKAIIVSPGIVSKLFKGKRVIPISKIIIGEKNILSFEKDNVSLSSLIHSIGSVVCHE
ncbi:PRC-barrel domain-containing protein [Clostridium sp. 19966]|uniref:PRC-barrel domain-containing protein n=1 Tax=Clostridium sp. 19966 TaxID=2768166 RepID=UPI0028E019C1|nr:PRC-barrel domain-containing protein [Clostridium sp. 19966]MDT8718119.1 PRC-barrel domain-containing protein [Clostridium sp. 19966]